MKTLIIIMSAMLFLAGCTAVQYKHIHYSALHEPNDVIQVTYNNCNIKLMTEGLKVTLPDGAILELGKREQIPDSNSMKAIGEAIGLGVGAAVAGGL